MNQDDYRYISNISLTIPETSIEVTIRNIRMDDIDKILQLQEISFADMASYGMIWPASYLKNHVCVFPEGQLCAEINGKIFASASSLVVTLNPQYSEHTWQDITGYGLFTTRDPKGDTLYGADISTHPKFQRKSIGTMLIAHFPFCNDINCRLYNTHWQEELIYSQVQSQRLCDEHATLLHQFNTVCC
jgi:ribosomal protein S18 acetylase RimI-like enzyme